jgi:hypothetical protein
MRDADEFRGRSREGCALTYTAGGCVSGPGREFSAERLSAARRIMLDLATFVIDLGSEL